MDKPLKIKFGNIVFKIISIFFPVKKRVFFIGSFKDKLIMNTQLVYDNLDCEKRVFTWNLPHSIWELIKLSYYIMTSKVIIVDNTNPCFAFIRLKKQQKLIQLWHACGPIKKLGLDRPSYNPYELFCNDQYDDFIVSSDNECKNFGSAYNIKEEVFTKIGYPSMDLLIHNHEKYEKEFFEKFPDLVNKKIIIYMPTFRLTNDYSGYLRGYDYDICWDNLNEYLSENNCIFLIKRHPVMLENDIKIITKEYSNILDIYDISNFQLLAASDLLITDYSGIFNEYLLLNKPVIFYCPDLEEYLKYTGLYFNISNDFPGTFCQTYDELKNAISNQEYDVDYSEYKEKFLKYCDGNSTKNLLKIINEYLE